jgi:hypothetical protein
VCDWSQRKSVPGAVAGANFFIALREHNWITPLMDFCVTIREGQAVSLVVINGGHIHPS